MLYKACVKLFFLRIFFFYFFSPLNEYHLFTRLHNKCGQMALTVKNKIRNECEESFPIYRDRVLKKKNRQSSDCPHHPHFSVHHLCEIHKIELEHIICITLYSELNRSIIYRIYIKYPCARREGEAESEN